MANAEANAFPRTSRVEKRRGGLLCRLAVLRAPRYRGIDRTAAGKVCSVGAYQPPRGRKLRLDIMPDSYASSRFALSTILPSYHRTADARA
jgi:hypothetical protein